GLLDLQTTPFSNIIPGAEIHANVIDNLLHGDPLEHDLLSEIGITFCLIVFGGLLLSAILAFGRPLPGAAAALLLIALTVAGCYRLLFLNGRVIGLTYPLLTIVAICLVVMLSNLRLVDREKRFIQGAFRHYLAPQVVSQLLQHPEQLSLVGQERQLSVIFSDIRDFTTLSEQLDSTALASFMNRYLSEMSRVVIRHQGMIDKFIGDAIMALWGAPLEDADHPLHAVSAALEMQERVALLAPEWQALGLPAISSGIGINTGVMRVGNFGSEELFDYTVVGDQVNLASRIEGLNKVYGSSILISEATRNAVCDQIVCRRIDLVRVKGKEQQVEIFEPVGFGREPDAEIREWEEVLDLYRQRAFGKAEKRLRELDAQSTRPLYRLYLARINQFRQNPPPPNWDRCFIHLRK
ncbi:MAG TPA: adenylate/guanylate cyclase domain-containing protein, partial [Geothermobacteraceae bacterium]|nr:adenylate/guanylate cyclase domain-containing protein [Geothermobacteraceae bacterium]